MAANRRRRKIDSPADCLEIEAIENATGTAVFSIGRMPRSRASVERMIAIPHELDSAIRELHFSGSVNSAYLAALLVGMDEIRRRNMEIRMKFSDPVEG